MKAGEIIANEHIKGDYYKASFYVPEIAQKAKAGQFVHIQIDQRQDKILRRPFSICDVNEDGILTILYKVVGHGTSALSNLPVGAVCDIIGPEGIPFSQTPADVIPVAVVGGYGAAATFMLSKYTNKGILLLGARTEGDVLLAEEYKKNGWDVRISTDDGSVGFKGRVTELIPQLLEDYKDQKLFFQACGPGPMLRALALELRNRRLTGELSVDQNMCCGVGACFGCVVKVVDPTSPDGWRYARSCSEGPVFPAEMIYIEA